MASPENGAGEEARPDRATDAPAIEKPSPNAKKLAILAGGGDLPRRLVDACKAQGRAFLVLALEPETAKAFDDQPVRVIGIGQVGTILKQMREARCEAVVMAGYVAKPDFSKLKLDFTGARLLPKVLASLPKGDDALLSTLVRFFESEGFEVIGADAVFQGLLAQAGQAGTHAPLPEHEADFVRARDVLASLGPFDVGQAIVVCRQAVLAIEAAEGTDAMLARVAELPQALRGTPEKPAGVLLKLPKPNQERRVDLPVIGLRTVEGAAQAGLAGIGIAAGGGLMVDRAELVAAADQAGLFVLGLPKSFWEAAKPEETEQEGKGE